MSAPGSSALRRICHFAAIVIALFGLAVVSARVSVAQPIATAPKEFEFHLNVKIPLRDGVDLNATLYTPRDQPGPAPCIVAMTPYIADTNHEWGAYFASHGLPFMIVDVRGRGTSEGVFRAFIQEAKDGFDIVEWLARQPYCNGKVGTWGGSYLGYAQWAMAKEFPPHLATIAPVSAAYPGADFPFRNNILYPFQMQWIIFTNGNAAQNKIISDPIFWPGFFRKWHESGRPFRDLDTLLGNPSPTFQEWLSHPEPDAYWDAYNPTAYEYARLQIPILTITGNYDDNQPGALEHYKQYMLNASPEGRARHYLIIGPWDHVGTRKPALEFGGIKVGPASLVDVNKLHVEWYAWTMQGGPKPEFLQKPVAYYVTGADKWRYADTLEAVTARYQAYFLDSSSNADDVFSSGSLGNSKGKGQADRYVYDPRDASGPEVEAEARTNGGSLVDQSVTLALRGKSLVYHSAPFEEDTEISGFFKLAAWISIDTADTDLYVSVHEIDQHGDSIRLSTDCMRARYREGLRTPKLVKTREPLLYDFNRSTFVSRVVKRGHRLRLVIAPMGRIIESTFAQRNHNGGGIVAEESAKDAKPVTVRLFHDAAHPSALQVPLGHGEL
jgi:uncharacterized protein